MNNRHQTDSAKIVFGMTMAICMLLASGCTKQLKTGYGRSRGTEFTSSVNGTIVLNKMIKSSNRRINHYRKVSPRWYEYDTIFWIPDHFGSPKPDAINKAEQWLGSDGDKTLVYISRDYDAEIVYWEKLLDSSAAEMTDVELKRMQDMIAKARKGRK